MKHTLLAMILVGGIAFSAEAKTIYVVKGNPGASEPYGDFATAAADIQFAVDYALPGDEVVVSNGVFEYSTQQKSANTNFVNVAKNISVRGLTGNPEDVILRLVGHTYYDVLRLVALSEGARLSGMVLENGYVNQSSGAGISLLSGSMISNCVIRGCESIANGGLAAVYASNEGTLVTHCVITNNTHSGNKADNAAGVYLNIGSRCENSLIANNRAAGNNADAGGVLVRGAASLRNCTIVNNTGLGYGAVKVVKADKLTGVISNCVLAANTATVGGTGYADRDPGWTARFWNCATTDGSKINDTCVFDDAGNLFTDYGAGDFRPASGSILIDKGAEWTDAPKTDLSGGDRVQGEAIDIGCYEFDATAFEPAIRTTGETTAIAPFAVLFSVSMPDAIKDHRFSYSWDLDGDGQEDSTAAEPRFEYVTPGSYDVSVFVRDLDSGVGAPAVRKGLVNAVARKMFVKSGNEGERFPYETEATAAAEVQTVIDAAIDDCEIVVLEGEYSITSKISVTKGVLLHGQSGNPEDVRVFASKSGVGLLSVSSSSAMVSGMSFSGADMTTSAGHALSVSGSGGTVSNCVFRNCKTSGNAYDGAAVRLDGPNSLITHCVISNCVDSGMSQDGCGGLELQNGSRAENCLVAGNRYEGSSKSETPCGGVCVRDGTLVNCTVVGNSSNRSVGGVRIRADGVCTIANCAIACNVGTVHANADPEWCERFSRCGTNDDQPLNATCVRGTPDELFCNHLLNDFHVKASSPLCGAGDNSYVRTSVDLDGNPRIVGRKVDIGCYESDTLPGLLLLVR